MRLSNRNRCRIKTAGLCVVLASFLCAGTAWGDTTLLAWDVNDEDLWSIDTALPLSSTFIGGGNDSFLAEIEYGFGVVYGVDTFDGSMKMVDPNTGQIFNTIELSYPTEGNVINAMEFVGATLYGVLATRGGNNLPSYLVTIDLVSGFITVIGGTTVDSPFGGLAYDMAGGIMYGVSAGGSGAELFTMDLGTGAATSLGVITVGGEGFKATALEFGGDDVLYTVPSMNDPLFGHVLTVDPATRLATDLGDAGLASGAIALTFQPAMADEADTTLAAWDTSTEDLWMVETAAPISSTFIGGNNTSFIPEIEYLNGVIYGSDSQVGTEFHLIDPATGLIFDSIDLTLPPQGNVITALEFVGTTLYGGLTTVGGGSTSLVTINLITGSVDVVGATGVNSPFGGLAYDMASGMMYAISSGGSDATLYTVDMMTGAAAMVAPVTFGSLPFRATALEFGGDGLLYTAASMQDSLSGHVLTIDMVTGVAADLGDAGMDMGPVALTYMGAIMLDDFETGTFFFWTEVVQ